MVKKDETVDEEIEVEETKPHKVEEDAPHKAFREIMELYKKQNPSKYERKQAEFARKLNGKLAFAIAADGQVLNGSLDANGKRTPIEIIEVK